MSGMSYKKNFIKKVIAKIDFASPVDIFNPETIAGATEEIKKRFPIAEQSIGSQLGVQITKEGLATADKQDFPEWVFHGSDRKKSLKVNKLFIEVLLTSYSTEDDFKADLISPISQLLKIHPQTIINRTGVRFINVFDFPELSFDNLQEYFSPEVSSHFHFMSKRDTYTRSFLVNDFMFNDIRLREQTGLFNPDYPAIIKRNHFVIDLDAFINFPHQITDIVGYFTNLHTLIESQFESLITDKMRKEVLNG